MRTPECPRAPHACSPAPRPLKPRAAHTSACVSIRQHTSAYVSIRQHTSAYVSIVSRAPHACSPAPRPLQPHAAPHMEQYSGMSTHT
jgi:hypothetical protein